MKKLMLMLAIAMALSLSSVAMAAKTAAGGAGLKGKITKIDGTKITVSDKKTSTDTVVVTDDSTKVRLDGADATFADLKEGMTVTVTPDTGTATLIEAKTKKAKKPTTAPAN